MAMTIDDRELFLKPNERTMYKDHEIPRFWITYSEALRRYLEKRVSDRWMIDDILHDVYLKVFVYCKRYDFSCEKAGVKNLRSWIFQVCHNTMVDRLKKDARYFYTPGMVSDIADSGGPAEQAGTCVTTLISRLPKKYADIIYMDTVLNINQADIASQLGLGISAAKSRIRRGKQMLRDMYLQTYAHK